MIKDFTKPGFLSTDGYVIFQYGGSWKKAVERARSRGPHALDQVHHGYYPFFVTELGSGHSRDAVVFIPLGGLGKDKTEELPTWAAKAAVELSL